MTSCMRMMSKSPSFSKGLVLRKSAQANSPSVSSVAKNFLALSIFPAARSSPATLHPACAKGRRFPPSPHPISRTLQPGPMFLYGSDNQCRILPMSSPVHRNTFFCLCVYSAFYSSYSSLMYSPGVLPVDNLKNLVKNEWFWKPRVSETSLIEYFPEISRLLASRRTYSLISSSGL